MTEELNTVRMENMRTMMENMAKHTNEVAFLKYSYGEGKILFVAVEI
jgi:hypothetical protein